LEQQSLKTQYLKISLAITINEETILENTLEAKALDRKPLNTSLKISSKNSS